VIHGPANVLIGKTHNAMGKLHVAEGNIESTMDSHMKALDIFFAAPAENQAAIACLGNIVTLCCKLNKWEKGNTLSCSKNAAAIDCPHKVPGRSQKAALGSLQGFLDLLFSETNG
jgi:hypothetical protein